LEEQVVVSVEAKILQQSLPEIDEAVILTKLEMEDVVHLQVLHEVVEVVGHSLVEVVGHQNSVLHVVNTQETPTQNTALHLAASLPNLDAFGYLSIPVVAALLFVRHQLPQNSHLVYLLNM